MSEPSSKWYSKLYHFYYMQKWKLARGIPPTPDLRNDFISFVIFISQWAILEIAIGIWYNNDS